MIPYTDFDGQGPELFFLHANGYPPACYTPLFAKLRSGFHITGMHLRPLWQAEKPGNLEDWRLLARDFIQFILERGSPPLLAVGHSVGAMVALRAALLEPHLFRAIVLIDPVLFPPSIILLWNLVRALRLGRKLHPMIGGALSRRREFKDLDLIFKGYRSRDVFRNFTDEGLWAYIQGIARPRAGGGYELVYSPEWEARIYYTGVWRDLEVWRALHTLQVPTLFIRGAQSNTFLAHAAARVEKINPDLRVKTINNAGHLVPLEHPQEVANLISSFVKELV